MICENRERSVSRDARAAELVVQAGGDEIDVLTDAVGAEGEAARCGEVIGTVLHEQVIVLDANRPVRGEGVFEAAPIVPPQRVSSPVTPTTAPARLLMR